MEQHDRDEAVAKEPTAQTETRRPNPNRREHIMTATKSNTEIILFAVLLYEADLSDDGPEQRQRLAQMWNGVSDTDRSLADDFVALMHGEALPLGIANASRLREIAREMCDPITEHDGWIWMETPDQRAAAFKRVRC